MDKLGIALLLAAGMAWAETPHGGWRHDHKAETGFVQPVNYPAASVTAEGQDNALALIQGRVAAKRKTPATLVVNGAAMPLLADESGHYARPYAFGSGSNSVEVRDGRQVRRVQFYEANASKPQARLRVLLSWDTPGTDLDLHVISPDGQHVFYGHRVANNGGALDVDVTTGYGPEIYASPAPLPGVYHVYVNYYGNGGDESDPGAITLAQVAVVSQEGTLSEKRQVVQVPLRNPGELTLIRSFSYP